VLVPQQHFEAFERSSYEKRSPSAMDFYKITSGFNMCDFVLVQKEVFPADTDHQSPENEMCAFHFHRPRLCHHQVRKAD
jgi:hypothetical protein